MVQISAISSILLITAASSTLALPTRTNTDGSGLQARSAQPQRLNLRSSTPPLPQGVKTDSQGSLSRRNNKNSKRNSSGAPVHRTFTGRQQTKERRILVEATSQEVEIRDHGHGHSHEHIHIHEHDVSITIVGVDRREMVDDRSSPSPYFSAILTFLLSSDSFVMQHDHGHNHDHNVSVV